jgi:hypothetical protein
MQHMFTVKCPLHFLGASGWNNMNRAYSWKCKECHAAEEIWTVSNSVKLLSSQQLYGFTYDDTIYTRT